MTDKEQLSSGAKKVEKVKAWIYGKSRMVNMGDVIDAFEYLEREAVGQMGSAVCTCKDWDDNAKEIDAIRWLLRVRNLGTTEADYDGKQFVYCPWCGHPVRS